MGEDIKPHPNTHPVLRSPLMPILIVHPHPHSPLCPNPCLAITVTQLSSAWTQGQEGPSPLQLTMGWVPWGSQVVGEQGGRWHREKHSFVSSCQAPAWCPETTLCSGGLNRSPQCQQSRAASPPALGTHWCSARHHTPHAQVGIHG